MDTEITSVWAELGEYERRTLLVLARRLLSGQRQYGVLDVERDQRDWNAEAAQEDADSAIYRAIAVVQAEVLRAPDAAEHVANVTLTVSEAARRLGVSESAVRQAVYARRLRAQKIGGTIFVNEHDIAAYQVSKRGRRRANSGGAAP